MLQSAAKPEGTSDQHDFLTMGDFVPHCVRYIKRVKAPTFFLGYCYY